MATTDFKRERRHVRAVLAFVLAVFFYDAIAAWQGWRLLGAFVPHIEAGAFGGWIGVMLAEWRAERRGEVY